MRISCQNGCSPLGRLARCSLICVCCSVVSVGDGKLLDDGTRGEMQVKVGDRVLFTSYAGENIEIGDEEYVLMGESEVLAVLE